MAVCYPDTTDWGCVPAEDLDKMDPAIKARAEMLAWNSLVRLTGFRLSLCPVVLRPCATGCNPQVWDAAPVNGWDGFSPYIRNGRWYNACGCSSPSDCSCSSVSEVVLPVPEVSGPIVVKINGATLDPSSYRIDNGNRLVRQDGDVWPLCQDMSVPETDEAAFTVSYYPGVGPDPMLNYAAGILALEWYKACSGSNCRLPSTTTQVVRQGVTITIPTYDTGLTGIREVDEVVAMYNPHRLVTPSRVISPDRMRGRMRTA